MVVNQVNMENILWKFNSTQMMICHQKNHWNFMQWQSLELFLKEIENIIHYFFRRAFVWVIKMLQYKKNDISEGVDTNKTSASKECMHCHIGTLKILVLSVNQIFAMVVII